MWGHVGCHWACRKGTSHTSSLDQPPPQKKQTSIVGLATGNATIAVASPEPLSSIEQPPPQKKQSSSAGLATICDHCRSKSRTTVVHRATSTPDEASIHCWRANFFTFPGCVILWCCTISQELVHRTTSNPEEASVQAKTWALMGGDLALSLGPEKIFEWPFLGKI